MRLAPERDPLPRLLAFVYAPLAVLVWFLTRWGVLWPAGRYRCPLLSLTGIACPTCGGVHAARAMGRGDLAAAWTENPLVAAGLTLLALWFLYALAATAAPRLRCRPVLGRAESRAWRLLFVLAVLATWAYEIRRHL